MNNKREQKKKYTCPEMMAVKVSHRANLLQESMDVHWNDGEGSENPENP